MKKSLFAVAALVLLSAPALADQPSCWTQVSAPGQTVVGLPSTRCNPSDENSAERNPEPKCPHEEPKA